MRRYLVCASVYLAIIFVTLSIRADDDLAAKNRSNDSIEVIVGTWKERGDRVRSAIFEWTTAHTRARGSLNKVLKELQDVRGKKLLPDEALVPAEDRLSEGNGKLMVEWPRMRYEATEELYSAIRLDFQRRRYTSSFDGSTHTMLREPEGGKAEVNIFPQAEELHFIEDVHLKPLLLALWPTHPTVSRIATEKLVRFEGTEHIESEECIRLAADQPNERREFYWVSPAKDHRIVRYRSELRGQPQTQFDIEYAMDQMWLPKRWRVTHHRFGDGLVEFEINSHVTAHSINKKIGKEAFDVIPPKDALISHEDPPAPRRPPLPKPPKPAQ